LGKEGVAMHAIKKKIGPYLFIMPHYLIFIIFFLIPAIMSVYVSFCNWDFVTAPRFTGLENYITILKDNNSYYFKLFWNSFKNTVGYVLISVPLLVFVPLFLSVALSKIKRGNSFFQSIFYFPYLLSVATVVLTWRWLLDKTFGVVNRLFHLDIAWNLDQPYFWIAVIVMSLWWGLGGNMVIYIAGMSSIPKDLYEAADIDGAGNLKKFVYITLPGLKNQMMYAIIITTIASFNIYGQPLMFANMSKLTNDKNVLLVAIQQTAFGTQQAAGMATAMAMVLGIILVIVSSLQFKLSNAE